jgi:hypothetical protein
MYRIYKKVAMQIRIKVHLKILLLEVHDLKKKKEALMQATHIMEQQLNNLD